MSESATEAAAGRNPFVSRDYRAWLTASVAMALGMGLLVWLPVRKLR